MHVDIVPDMNDKLLVALMGGVAPDVVLLDRWLTSSFAAQGALVALDPYIARDGVNPDDYFPATWEEATYRGTSYGIPFNTDTRALLYHASMFAEAGLDPDRPPSTWDDLWEITPRLSRAGRRAASCCRWVTSRTTATAASCTTCGRTAARC